MFIQANVHTLTPLVLNVSTQVAISNLQIQTISKEKG